MNNEKLNVYVALDRSGSMASQWKQSIEAINEYVNGLKNEKIEGTISVVAFDSNSENKPEFIDLVKEQSIAYFDPISAVGDVQPRGMTPLYDAAANVMNRALEANSERTVVVIMTDGHENSSKEFTQKTVKDKVEQLTAKGWEVLFLGANFDVAVYTHGAGLDATKMRNFNPTNSLDNARLYNDLSVATTAYARTGASMDLRDQTKVSNGN